MASIRQPSFAFRSRYLRMIWRPSVALPTLCSAANRSSRSKSGISSGIVTVRVEPPANVTARCRRAYARSNRMHCTPLTPFWHNADNPFRFRFRFAMGKEPVCHVRSERGRLAAGNSAKLSPFLLQMRMNVRVEECRRRAAECAEKALLSTRSGDTANIC
jgi:hypothetical protein